jgi:hypothetical protein
MRGTTLFVSFGVMMVGHAAMFAQNAAPQKAGVDAPKGYETPQAVYDAIREAKARGDYRGEITCLGDEFRNELIFSAWCERNTPTRKPDARAKLDAIFKKHGSRPGTKEQFQNEYNKRYTEKYGIAPEIYNPIDIDLRHQIIADKVSDKIAFLAEAHEIIGEAIEPEPIPMFKRPTNFTANQIGGELRNIQISASAGGCLRATAIAKMPIPIFDPVPAWAPVILSAPPKVTWQYRDQVIRFRRTKDGWLLERLLERAEPLAPPNAEVWPY